MLKSNEQIKIETQKSIDIMLDLVTTSIHGVEKLTYIQLEVARQILAETTQSFKDLSLVADSKEVMARVNTIATQAVEKNIASARDVFDVVSELHAKISQLTEGNLQHIQQSALNSVEGFAKYNPSGAEVAGDSVKAWIQSSNQALATLNKVSAQVGQFASSNIDTVANASLKASKKSSAK